MALEHFWWGPSLDLLRDSCNGALWLEHSYTAVSSILLLKYLTKIYFHNAEVHDSWSSSVVHMV